LREQVERPSSQRANHSDNDLPAPHRALPAWARQAKKISTISTLTR
jgi:hypothetical protein